MKRYQHTSSIPARNTETLHTSAVLLSNANQCTINTFLFNLQTVWGNSTVFSGGFEGFLTYNKCPPAERNAQSWGELFLPFVMTVPKAETWAGQTNRPGLFSHSGSGVKAPEPINNKYIKDVSGSAFRVLHTSNQSFNITPYYLFIYFMLPLFHFFSQSTPRQRGTAGKCRLPQIWQKPENEKKSITAKSVADNSQN